MHWLTHGQLWREIGQGGTGQQTGERKKNETGDRMSRYTVYRLNSDEFVLVSNSLPSLRFRVRSLDIFYISCELCAQCVKVEVAVVEMIELA